VQSRTSSAPCIAETKGENINIRWSPDGQHIAVGDKDDNISLIETRKSKPLKNIKFAFEVNEMAWDPSGKLFFLTTGGGTVEVFRYLDMLKPGEVGSARTLHAHTANCYCIEFAPNGEYFAVGSADALVSLWHLQELVCMRTFERLEWPVRTLSFSHDSAFIASGSEDPQLDIADVATSQQVHSIPCSAPMNTVSWHPTRHLLAYAGDDKNKAGQDEGNLRIFGFP
jgi:THO complex subunit 3